MRLLHAGLRDVALRAAASARPGPKACRSSDVIAGNLCRCTGYGPILDAGEADAARGRPTTRETASRRCARSQPRLTGHPRARADELADLLLAHPETRIVAGATDVGLWVTKQHRDLGPTVFIGDIADLRQIEESPTALTIGAARPLFRGAATRSPASIPISASWSAASAASRSATPARSAAISPTARRSATCRPPDRARRRAGAAPGRRAPHDAARGLLPRLRQAGPRSRASSSRASASPAPPPTR